MQGRAEGVASAAEPDRPRFWNVPNSLTMSRLLLSFVVFGLIAYEWYATALVFFALTALTDWLDGYFARLLNQTSAVGRQLDPLVDKVAISGGLIYLVTIPGTGLTAWMVTAIVVRELVIQGLRSSLEGQGVPFGARWAGKLKTTAQCLAIVAILLCLAVPPPPQWVLLWTRNGLIWAAVGLTLYSGFAYLIAGWPMLQAAASAPAPAPIPAGPEPGPAAYKETQAPGAASR